MQQGPQLSISRFARRIHEESRKQTVLRANQLDQRLAIRGVQHLRFALLFGVFAHAIPLAWFILPAVGRHELLVVARDGWREQARIPLQGQPVFAVARPDGRQIWVNFAHPRNDTVQVIDVATRRVVKTLKPGKAVLHLEFTPRGEQVWLSVRDGDRIEVYDSESFERLAQLPADKPSGIFLTARANKIGL